MRFVHLTTGTCFDVIGDILFDRVPIIDALDEFDRLVLSWVAREGGIMVV